LAVVAVADVYYAARYNYAYSQKLRPAQRTIMVASSARNQINTFVQVMGADLIEYSKKNPSIDPLLQNFGFKAGGAPAPKPAKP
jgi:hypothetical protein